MKSRAPAVLLLLFIPAFTGELLSGSSPPGVFFNPFTFALLVVLYGCGTLLIREARAHWKLQWSVLFLAAAYGILEEGLLVKSFFNPDWVDLGPLSGYGMFGGVQWVWAVQLVLYHATVSTMIPIALVDHLFPDLRDSPLLGFRGVSLAFAGLTGVTVWGAAFMGSGTGSSEPFQAPPLLMVLSLAAVVLLTAAAWLFKRSTVRPNRVPLAGPFAFAVCGFLFQVCNLLIPGLLAETGVPASTTLAVQGGLAAGVLLFVFLQLNHERTGANRITGLVFGSLLCYIAMAPFHEFVAELNPDSGRGMVAVAAAALGLLIFWRRAALRRTQAAGQV
jgi:hypothetical protein